MKRFWAIRRTDTKQWFCGYSNWGSFDKITKEHFYTRRREAQNLYEMLLSSHERDERKIPVEIIEMIIEEPK